MKVEINTRERKSLFGIRSYPFVVDSDWYQGKVDIASFDPEEVFGTKLRALLQRRKNHDLFDLGEGLKQLALDVDKLIAKLEFAQSINGRLYERWRDGFASSAARLLRKKQGASTPTVVPRGSRRLPRASPICRGLP